MTLIIILKLLARIANPSGRNNRGGLVVQTRKKGKAKQQQQQFPSKAMTRQSNNNFLFWSSLHLSEVT